MEVVGLQGMPCFTLFWKLLSFTHPWKPNKLACCTSGILVATASPVQLRKGGIRRFEFRTGEEKAIFNAPLFVCTRVVGADTPSGWVVRGEEDTMDHGWRDMRTERHAKQERCALETVLASPWIVHAAARTRRGFLGTYHHETSPFGPDRAHPQVCKHEYVPPHDSSDAQNAPYKASATSFSSFHVVSDRTAVVFHRPVAPFFSSCTHRVPSSLFTPPWQIHPDAWVSWLPLFLGGLRGSRMA